MKEMKGPNFVRKIKKEGRHLILEIKDDEPWK